MMVTRRSTGEFDDAGNEYARGSTLALKRKTDVTSSPTQGYQKFQKGKKKLQLIFNKFSNAKAESERETSFH